MPCLSGLLERFSSRELEIHRLCARDADFRGVCEDYEVALKALKHWEGVEGDSVRAVEYRDLAGEIADEITGRLDAAAASSTTPEPARSGQQR
jgi:hypothetical protein